MKKGLKAFIRIMFGLWVAIGFFYLFWWLVKKTPVTSTEALSIALLFGLLFGTCAWSLTPFFLDCIKRSTNRLGNQIIRIPLSDMIGPIIGLILGLVVAVLLNSVLGDINVIGTYISIFLLVVIPYVSTLAGYRKRNEIYALFTSGPRRKERVVTKGVEAEKPQHLFAPKVVDTSAIIDGRIFYICRTGFLEGDLIITHFVLDELRHIADSEDELRRAKGRRGLDILNRLTKELGDRVVISDIDYPDITEVDSKLVRLALENGGGVITTDYNLNKVAQVHGVRVFNVNELSNAVKPVVIPGEEMRVDVIKAGKERNQGVAYLDDGTMIVVEDGKNFIGKSINAVVTSVLQTAAGRMIFVKIDK